MDFKPGDVVLKSGGPNMTVQFINTEGDHTAHCQWFNREHNSYVYDLKSASFPLASLNKK